MFSNGQRSIRMWWSNRIPDLGSPVWSPLKAISAILVVSESFSDLVLCGHDKWTWTADTTWVLHHSCYKHQLYPKNTKHLFLSVSDFVEEMTPVTYRVVPQARWLVVQQSAQNGKPRSPKEKNTRGSEVIFVGITDELKFFMKNSKSVAPSLETGTEDMFTIW